MVCAKNLFWLIIVFMSVQEAAVQLSEILESNRSVFLKTEPEVPDFTLGANFKFLICVPNKTLEIEASPSNIVSLIALFDATIFDKTQIDRIYAWNIKGLATYFYAFTKKFLNPENNLLDLKIIESFLGVKNNPPENFTECIHRVKAIVKNKSWQSLYKSIHMPLALRVLPSIETQSLLDEQSKKPVFPYYEIEGQINGRMNCFHKYAKSYLPHTMGPDVKKYLKPRGYGYRFLCSDFRHCEVTVLQWLSKDERLKEILESGADLHKQIYEIVTGDQCNSDNKRNLSKKMFLPVMYGCGPRGLAQNLSITEGVASELIGRIKQQFPIAWEWMQTKQESAKQGPVEDFFGRSRLFNEKQSYLARNFSVQGVAATVCQEKIIALSKALDNAKAYIVFSVHDGFGLVCQIKAARETYKLVKQVCEVESTLCPGLSMKSEIKFGAKLDQMKVLWKD